MEMNEHLPDPYNLNPLTKFRSSSRNTEIRDRVKAINQYKSNQIVYNENYIPL